MPKIKQPPKTPNTCIRCPDCGSKLWRVMWGDYCGTLVCRPDMGGCGYHNN